MMADLLNHLWQSTVFVAGVALLSSVCRGNRARVRYGLWFVASAKFLVPFAALTAAGSLMEWVPAPAPVATVMTASVLRGVSAPFAEMSLQTFASMPAASGTDWIPPWRRFAVSRRDSLASSLAEVSACSRFAPAGRM